MSEDTPEKVDDQPEEPAVKKKTAKKRSKAPEPKVVEKAADDAKESSEAVAETSADAEKPTATERPSPKDKPAAQSDSEDKSKSPDLEDGETPTENPSVRRISSKRKSGSTPSEGDDAPDQIPTIVEPPSAEGGGKKRRRRRRKGSGDGDDGGDEGRQGSRSGPRINLDPEKVEKKAWKIFLSEVSEEGLALVSDQDAKEIGRRSFRLAEIFLEEASKRQ